ncbi:MAG: isochorismatase family protein [Candidatus Acidiferrales bacterium]
MSADSFDPGAAGDLDRARAVYRRSGIGGRVGFGSRPALLIVDFQRGFTDPSCAVGGELSREIAATRMLLVAAREKHLPVAFTAVGFDSSGRDGATWLHKMPGLAVLVENSPWCEIDDRVKPLAGEPVWIKRASSAFFGTPIIPFLTAAGVDTLIVTGCVTSGCIRATTVDAVSFGYRTIVPAECVGDRAEAPHKSNLFDIDAKYADVEPIAYVLAHIAALHEQ